jgi:hypothetical protein
MVAHVRWDDDRTATERFDLPSGVDGGFSVDVHDADIGALLRKAQRDRPANALPAACYQSDLSIQYHGTSSPDARVVLALRGRSPVCLTMPRRAGPWRSTVA